MLQTGKASACQRAYHDVPEGTLTINRASRDPKLTATSHGYDGERGLLAELREELQDVYGIDIPKTEYKNASKAIQGAQEELAFQKYLRPAAIRSGVDPRTPEGEEALRYLRHGKEAVKEKSGKIIEEAKPAPAQTLVEHLRKQPKETLNTGLFNKTVIEDWADYAEHTAIATANLRAMHGFLRQAARLTDDPELDEVPLMTAWQSVKSRGTKNRDGRRLLEDRGATTFAREYGEQLAKKGQKAPDEFKALFPQGWQGTDEQIEQLLGSVHVPAKTADVMAKYIDIAGPEARSFLGEIYDKYMSAFKFGVTAAPAFHVRNLIDGQWRNYCLSGPDTFPILGKNGLVRAMRDWSKYLKGNKDAVEPEFVKMLEQAHLVEGKGSLVQVLDREAVDMGGDIPQGGFTSIFDPLRPSNWEKGESWNPLNLAGFRAQQRTIKDAKGIERKVDWSKQFAPAEVHNNTFRYVESMNRHPAMLAMLRNGMDPATAKHMIMRTQYDYSKMSPFERKVMRRVFPFWGFLSNNIPYQMSQLFNYPGGKTAITLRAMNALHGELGSNLPSWMTEGFAMKIPEFLGGKDEESGKTQVLRKLGLSLEDLGNISMQGHMPSQRTFQRFLANASPAVTLPIKHVFDIDPYSGRSTRDMKGLTGDPWLDSLIYASPASRVIRTGEMLGQDLPAWQKALNLASGVKIGGYELDQLRDLDDRRILLDTLKKNPNIGFAEHPYLNRAGKEAADEDAQASIRLLKQITQRISQRAKERRDREARG